MKLLLDTHILLWYLEGHPNLPETQRQQIEDRRNQVAVSAVNLENSVATPLMPFDAAQDRLRYAQETALLSTNGVVTNLARVRSP